MPISAAMITALTQGTFTPVTVIRVTAKATLGGGVMAFASHTRDIIYDGSTFLARPFEPSKMSQASGFSVDNAEVSHLLGETFSKIEVQGGKWAGATIELMVLNLHSTADGPARRHLGRVGDVTTNGTTAKTEFRGLMYLLNQELGDRTSRRSRHQLGDADCGVNLAAYTFAGTIVAITNNQKFTVTTNQATGYFKYGRIVFTSGVNNGLEMDLINNVGQSISLFKAMPGTVAVGNTFNLIAGCDKTLATCHSKFNNAPRFGGEDSLPTREDVYKFPE